MSEKKKTPEASQIYVKQYGVDFGGEHHKLMMDMEAFGALEDAGYEYAEIVKMATSASFKNMPLLLWAGTRHEGNDLTPEQIRKMVDLPTFTKLTKTVQTAILNVIPDPDEDESPKDQGPQEKTQSPAL
jgi:hypothetical protein